MKQEEKKEREKKILRPLCLHLGVQVPDNPNQERPDFVIVVDKRRIGIEVTFCCPSKKNSHTKSYSVFAACNNRIQKAKAEYIERMKRGHDNRAIVLSLTPKTYCDTSGESEKEFVESFCQELSECLNSYQSKPLNSLDDVVEEIVSRTFEDDVVKSQGYINTIDFVCYSKEPIVAICDSHQTQYVKQTDLDEEFCVKNKKLEKYKEKVDNADISEYWLVLGIHEDEPYEFYDLHQIYNKKKCLFHRVFISQYGQINEVE